MRNYETADLKKNERKSVNKVESKDFMYPTGILISSSIRYKAEIEIDGELTFTIFQDARDTFKLSLSLEDGCKSIEIFVTNLNVGTGRYSVYSTIY